MLLKISTAIAAIALYGTLANASVLGTWSGELTYSYLDEANGTCTAENTVTQTETTLNFHQVLSGSCNSALDVNLDVNGNDLLSNGVVVGSITEDALVFENVAIDSYGDTYSVNLTVNADGTAAFQDRFNYSGNPEDYDSLAGAMSPKAPESVFSLNRNAKSIRHH